MECLGHKATSVDHREIHQLSIFDEVDVYFSELLFQYRWLLVCRDGLQARRWCIYLDSRRSAF